MELDLERNRKNSMLYSDLLAIGIGRRKTAVAIVKIYKLNSTVLEPPKLIINDQFSEVFLQFNATYLNLLNFSLRLLNLENKYFITVKTKGGGLSGKTGAISLGLARGLCKINAKDRSILKFAGLLRRDSRSVERKKYGLKKARKASQYSKR